MSSSPEMFSTPKRRKLSDMDGPSIHRVNVGQTLVLYKGHVMRANYCGIPCIIPGTSLCKIVRNIAASPLAYIFIYTEEVDKFKVITNSPGTSELVFSPF
jgi:hypothetical protein